MGDITSITALSLALLTVLIEAKYSRAFETEADQYALQYLQSHGISTQHFADILMRIEKDTGDDKKVISFLSSHPTTGERIRLFKDNG